MLKTFGDARDNSSYTGQRSTMPPKTRHGEEYPGGKRLRKALAKLRIRNTRHMADVRNGHERGPGYYEPGSPARQWAGSMKG